MATAFVAFVCANADTNDAWMASIRMDHPRMFFNADTWPQVKARAEGPARAERDALLKRCDSYPENPKCSGTESATLSAKFKNSASSMPIPAVKEWGPQARGARGRAGPRAALPVRWTVLHALRLERRRDVRDLHGDCPAPARGVPGLNRDQTPKSRSWPVASMTQRHRSPDREIFCRSIVASAIGTAVYSSPTLPITQSVRPAMATCTAFLASM